MIFPPSQTSVALRSTDDELARRVEIKCVVISSKSVKAVAPFSKLMLHIVS
jgi:hypothetical protein